MFVHIHNEQPFVIQQSMRDVRGCVVCEWSCVCVRAHAHTHTHTYTHAHIHAYTRTHTRTHAHTHTHTHAIICIHARDHMHARARAHTNTHAHGATPFDDTLGPLTGGGSAKESARIACCRLVAKSFAIYHKAFSLHFRVVSCAGHLPARRGVFWL